jgi:hypothetical protein
MAILDTKAGGRALLWTFLTSFVGLSQIIFAAILGKLLGRQLNLDSIIRDGILLIFVMTLVGTIVIDYYFARGIRFPKWFEGLCFALIPFVVALFVALAYSALHIVDLKSINIGTATKMQFWGVVLALGYSLVVKYLSFLDSVEDK